MTWNTWLPERKPDDQGELSQVQKDCIDRLHGYLSRDTPGSILVTGFRGSGKSMIVRAAAEYRAWSDWEGGRESNERMRLHLVAPIHVARPSDIDKLLRRILRKIYLASSIAAIGEIPELRSITKDFRLAYLRSISDVEVKSELRERLKSAVKTSTKIASKAQYGIECTAEEEIQIAEAIRIEYPLLTAEDMEDELERIVHRISLRVRLRGPGLGPTVADKYWDFKKRIVDMKNRINEFIESAFSRGMSAPVTVTVVVEGLDRVGDVAAVGKTAGVTDRGRNGTSKWLNELLNDLVGVLGNEELRAIVVGGPDLAAEFYRDRAMDDPAMSMLFKHHEYVPIPYSWDSDPDGLPSEGLLLTAGVPGRQGGCIKKIPEVLRKEMVAIWRGVAGTVKEIPKEVIPWGRAEEVFYRDCLWVREYNKRLRKVMAVDEPGAEGVFRNEWLLGRIDQLLKAK